MPFTEVHALVEQAIATLLMTLRDKWLFRDWW